MAASVAHQPVLKTGITLTFGVAVLASICLLGLVATWMTLTMISGAIVAQGEAVVRGKPKVVQSLDGGVVGEIFVKDGDVVKVGQALLRFDPTLLNINLDIYRTRLAEVIAREARLEAEYLGRSEITVVPAPKGIDASSLERHFAGQKEIFEARNEVLLVSRDQLQERISQYRNQITGVEGRIEAIEDQLEFVGVEIDRMQVLKDKDLVPEKQVLDLLSSRSVLLGTLSETKAELAQIFNSIRDTELEMQQLERRFREEVVTELREATTAREELVLQIAIVEKQLERIIIRAPVDGVIHEMQVFTIGGVVAPEGTILEVVPISEGVEFELRIDPKSIDQVFVGQRARVVFPAFDMRSTPEIFGTVAGISPTSIADPQTGQSYYRLTVTVPADNLALLGDVEMIPGMPIEAFLETGERSVLNYLTKPLTDQLQRAFRE